MLQLGLTSFFSEVVSGTIITAMSLLFGATVAIALLIQVDTRSPTMLTPTGHVAWRLPYPLEGDSLFGRTQLYGS